MRSERLFDLLDLRNTDALHLSFTNTIAVEDYLGRRSTIVAFEGFNGTRHASLQIRRTLLADFVLDDTCGPVGCSRLIHRSSQS